MSRDAPPPTPLEVLQKVNHMGGTGFDRVNPALNECLAKNWLIYKGSRKRVLGPKCSFYAITEAGKAARTRLIQEAKGNGAH